MAVVDTSVDTCRTDCMQRAVSSQGQRSGGFHCSLAFRAVPCGSIPDQSKKNRFRGSIMMSKYGMICSQPRRDSRPKQHPYAVLHVGYSATFGIKGCVMMRILTRLVGTCSAAVLLLFDDARLAVPRDRCCGHSPLVEGLADNEPPRNTAHCPVLYPVV